MASRRLDISSLLCDDAPPPTYSPLEALVHAATEERKRLDAAPYHHLPQTDVDDEHRPLHGTSIEPGCSTRTPSPSRSSPTPHIAPTTPLHIPPHLPPRRDHRPASSPRSYPQPSREDPRPIKKRRFSESPTRPFPDDKERIARERDKMLVGELGYGRVDSPAAPGPSHPPRRPGSGHGHSRKPVAVSDLLIDKEPSPREEVPPGSQIGRAKAARKSDDHLLREPPPLPAEPEVKKLKEEPKIKPESKPTRFDDTRSTTIEEPRPKKPKEVPPPPKVQLPKPQQEDAHEWFLQQFDQDPSPTTSARPEPPHSPSPSPSPVITVAPPPSAKSPPPRKPLTPIPPPVPTLEQELEELVSDPTHTSTAIAKKQDLDMDLDVDLAVTELVDTLEEDSPKHESVGMEVDVEDELLSLVDDRPPPPAPPRRAPGSASASVSHAHAPPPSVPSIKPAPPVHRSVSEARQEPSPPSMPASAAPVSAVSLVRQSSARPTPERGSMPPPASTNISAAAKKGAERAGSVAPAGPSAKKKKEPASKAKAKTTTAAASAAKPRAKPAAAKGKKTIAIENATPAVAPVKPFKALPSKKTVPSVSRSRSTSVMPGRSASAGPETEAVKAEKQEEEEESEPEKEDDKLYCVCKTKYDEDRFMIACDRCDEWYHTQCVHMPDLEVDLVDQFICPLCVEKNPQLNLMTTYKQRCLYGLRHPDPDSTRACHKAARGAFSKYCSDECGVKYMQSRIDSWAKKGGKPEKLWESVKNAEKRDGVVVCAVEPEANGVAKQEEEDGEDAVDLKPITQHIVPAKKTKIEQETERLDMLLDSVIKLREELKHGMEVVVWRERLLQLASQRAEAVGHCGWDQRLCLDDEEWEEMGDVVLESYENAIKPDGVLKEECAEGEMEVDGAEEHWWCPGDKVCDRHAGWQSVRLKDVAKEKEKKEEALAKLTTREREIRKRIEDMLDPQNTKSKTALVKDTNSNAPLKASNTKVVNGHPKSKGTAANGEALKKGKKRKAPAS
ncbi:hypothetical protein CPB84DRAFT_1841149 [Gymnopilus junonius]|uniref:PHD-type domain-containing protein n=1 Tax=Gymnopilus junonius TaxID=109634 RepID=A0A9P5TUY8_GYMJU|nr:hypothetical protein CPB84DRAFT_1841149 [Gymnopilus junonius]